MPQSPYSSQLASAIHGVEITTEHFGANCVATANFANDGGPFDTAVQTLGITHLRYPGGTVTEERLGPSPEHWHQMLTSGEDYVTLEDGSRVQTLSSLLDYAAANDIEITFVLPTSALLSDGMVGDRLPNYGEIDSLVSSFTDALRANPNSAQVTCIEIGNEYYYQGRMTAEEYGDLANYMVQKVEAAMNQLVSEIGNHSGFAAPDIAVQAGAGWQPGDNETILDLLDDSTKSMIDAVVTHYYPRTHDTVGSFDRHLNELDDWRADPAFGDLRFFASEWNIQNSDASDNGMLHAGALVAAFEEMLLEGIDVAAVWGTQYRSLDTRLTTLSHRDTGDTTASGIDTDLTAAGEVFSIMRTSLIGLRPIDIDPTQFIRATSTESGDETHLRVTDFGDEDRYVAFVSNRSISDSLQLETDLRSFFGSEGHISVRLLTPTDDPNSSRVDESDPELHQAEPDLDYLYSGSFELFPEMLTIPEGAIAVLELTFGQNGVLLSGQDPASDESFIDYEDSLVGTSQDDTLLGQTGDDTLIGDGGRDLLGGGTANDLLSGGLSSDALFGGAGSDTLLAEDGDDAILDGDGDDRAFGGSGDDLFFDGTGSDFLTGDDGADTFFVADGQNTVVGGHGADHLFVRGSGETTFSDFDTGSGDRIDLSVYFDDLNSLRLNLEEAIGGWSNGSLLRLEVSEAAAVEFSYDGASVDELLTGFRVGSNADATSSLAESLERLSFDQVASMASDCSQWLTLSEIRNDDQGNLFEQLSPDTAAAYLVGLSPSEIRDLVNTIGSDEVFSRLQSLSDETVIRMFSSASANQLEAIFHNVSGDSLADWYSSMPGVIQSLVSESVDGTVLPRPELLDDDDDDDDVTGILSPPDDEEAPEDRPIIPEVPEDRATESDDDDGDDEEIQVSGDCFIATVAFADPDHPIVWLLRWYRDMVLRKSLLGRWCVAFYWIVGPMLAKYLSKASTVRAVSRRVFTVIGKLIAWYYSRDPGQQQDHVVWEENRQVSFWVSVKIGVRKWK